MANFRQTFLRSPLEFFFDPSVVISANYKMSCLIEELCDYKLKSFVSAVEIFEESFHHMNFIKVMILEVFGPLDAYRLVFKKFAMI